MKTDYQNYSSNEITKEILDEIKVGDLVKCNDWGGIYRAVAVSDNHIIIIRKHLNDDYEYNIIEKVKSTHSRILYLEGYFRYGADNSCCSYSYYNLNDCKKALDRLKDGLPYNCTAEGYHKWLETICEETKKFGDLSLSRIRAMSLFYISFKHTKYNEKNIQEWLDKIFAKLIQNDKDYEINKLKEIKI